MAIWVRLQDKKILAEVGGFEIIYNGSFWVIGGVSMKETVWLAEYYTETKALEVLNNIQEWLKTCDIRLVHQVYEMPQDS